MNTRIRSRSAITFEELKNKTEEVYEFGNDWGLYVDIEMNYNSNFKKQKINTSNFSLFKIFERINEDEDEDEEYNQYKKEYEEYKENGVENDENKEKKKINYFNSTKLFLTKLAFYLCLVLGFNFYLDKNKK